MQWTVFAAWLVSDLAGPSCVVLCSYIGPYVKSIHIIVRGRYNLK